MDPCRSRSINSRSPHRGCAVHRIRRKIKSKALLCGSTNLNKKHLQNCFSNDKPENFHLLFFVVAEIIEYNLFYNMN